MVNEVVRIRHPVPLNIRPARIPRIRPPIVAFRKEIVLAAGASAARRCSNCDRLLTELSGGCSEHALSVEICKIERFDAREYRSHGERENGAAELSTR